MRRLCFLAWLGLTVIAFGKADDVFVATSPGDAPYVWDQLRCTLGESDLKISTVVSEKEAGFLQFTFRNFADGLKKMEPGKAASIQFASTKELAMSFGDREGIIWAFLPVKNHSFCDLKLQREENGEVRLWGKCSKLLDVKESLCTHVEISEKNPLRCIPVKPQ